MEPRDIVGRNDRRDQWLDSALQEYGRAEPRLGLESRILANLAVERARARARRQWWAFGVAVVVACVPIVVWVGGMNHSKSLGKIAGNTTSAVQTTGAANRQSEVKRPVVEAAVQPRTRPYTAKKNEVAEEPRLSQFPSPRPLSEQEQLLVRYVTDAPSEAVLIAKEQADWRREMQESGDHPPETESGDLNQEER